MEHHGIRLDVISDNAATVYAMRCRPQTSAVWRSGCAFIRGLIDRSELLKGHFYSELSDSYIIIYL